jgi:lipopolysaccharide/colanic/teichoic acid biosynthesis glycosyltransferase/glycosyltransferase involved in cell wall biosynthesis
LGFLDRQVGYAIDRGCEVHAVASPGKELGAFAERTGAVVHAVEMSRRITPWRDLQSLGNLIEVFRRIRPDVVHGHTPKGGMLAMLAAWMCRVPVRVYHLHGLPMATATGLKRRVLRYSERVSCRLAHKVFCVSPSLREVALAEGLCEAEKMGVLLNGTIDGVDAEGRFNPARVPGARAAFRQAHGIPAEAPVIGFVGRVVRDKGVAELIEAWKVLRAESPQLRLLVVGPAEPHDPPPPAFHELVAGDNRVHWVGEVEIEDMPCVYTAMNVLVLPTYREGFGAVLLEAAAMGVPTVATKIPGCKDAVRDGETGTLVPVRDAGAVAAAVRTYLCDDELRRRHGAAGRARALADFRPQALSEALFREYLRLSHRRGTSAAAATGSERGPVRPSFYRRRGKRLFDIVVSALALAALAPLLLVLAVLVRFFHGAPVLFRQVRSGFNRRPFTILKFRTMTDERDAAGELLPDTRRLTRFGRLLRATSLDELPELWNVLRGDMSLVGPRPLLPRYDTCYTEQELRRFDLLPGITGWAQINGRNDLAWDDRLACDVSYAEAYSFALDLAIMARTVIKVLRRDNVQPDPGATFGALDEERRGRAAAEMS